MAPNLKNCPSVGPIPWSVEQDNGTTLNGPMLVEDGPDGRGGGRDGDSESADGRDALAGRHLDELIADPICQRLFRLFLVFAGDNLVRTPEGRLLRCITGSQARFLIGQIGMLRDQIQIAPDRPLASSSVHSEEDAQLMNAGGGGGPCQWAHAIDGQLNLMAFPQHLVVVTFRQLLGHALALCPRPIQLGPLVDRLFARYVLQIVRKGFLLCRPVRPLPRALRPFTSCLLPSSSSAAQLTPAERMATLRRRGLFRPSAGRWRPFWCVLAPGQLHLWPLAARKGGGGQSRRSPSAIPLEMDPLELGGAATSGARWTLRLTKDSLVELSDLERGGQLFGWLLATPSGLVEFAHFDQLQRQLWIADLEMVCRKRRPSLLLRFDRLNSCRIEPERGEGARGRSPSVGKHAALEKENRALLELLESERRALKDEETVRELATRMLDEEVQRGEGLRQTVQVLATELEAERQQRIQLQNRLFEQQQQQKQLSPSLSSQQPNSPNSPAAGGWAEEEGNAEERGQNGIGISLLVPPERLVTPMPRAKRGKRLRDSLKKKREMGGMEKKEASGRGGGGGGEELKVVNVEAAGRGGRRMKEGNGGKGGRMDEESGGGRRMEEEEKEDAQKEELKAAEFTNYEQGGTLRAADYWDAQKCGGDGIGGGQLEAANLLMIMSTRSV